MARYKHYDYGQMKMLPVSFDRQILPGTFEHTLNRLIDEDFDLSVFEVTSCAATARRIALGSQEGKEVPRRQRRQGESLRTGEEEQPHRQRERQDEDSARRDSGLASRNRRAGVRQHRTRSRLEALQPARQGQGQHPVASLLPRAQHRQVATLWGKRKRDAKTPETRN